jgi:hypothetical protein
MSRAVRVDHHPTTSRRRPVHQHSLPYWLPPGMGAPTRRVTTVAVHAITSLPFAQASPARLADLPRRHWAIEALHHVRGPRRPVAAPGISLGWNRHHDRTTEPWADP